MKLLSVDVKSFGNLTGFQMDFASGLNVVCENNGFGKTTLAAFIKAMFYGVNYTTKRDILQNEYKKLKPFNSVEKFGGILRFNHDGKNYRVERFFGGTLKEQELRVFDDDTNKQYKVDFGEPTKELGYKLFDVDADAFMRSVYFPQSGVVVESNDCFVKKLSNLAQSTEDENSFEKADARLRDFCKQLKYEKGFGGKIYELTERKRVLQQKLDNAIAVRQKTDNLNKSVTEATAVIDACSKQILELNKKLLEAEKTIKQFEGVEQALKTEQSIKDKSIEEAQLAQQLKQAEEALNTAEALVVQREQLVQAAVLFEPAVPVSATQKRLGLPVWQVALCIVALLAGVGLSFFRWYIGAPVILAAISMFVAFYLKFNLTVKQESAKKEKKLLEELSAIKEQQNAREIQLKQLAQSKSERDQALDAKVALMAKLMSVRQLIDESKKQLCGFSVGTAKKQAETLTQARQQKIQLSDSIAHYEQKQRASEQILAADGRELFVLTQNPVDPSDIEGEILSVSEEILLCQDKFDTAKSARELLSRAKEALTNAYLPKLNQKFNDYLTVLTSGRLAEGKVDAEFSVSVKEAGSFRDVAYLSEGFKEICNFALRLALMTCIYGDTLPLLVLDDPFVNYDKANSEAALRLLFELSKTTQVLLLTCHSRFKN